VQSVLAYMELSSWAALVSSVAASVVAWMSFTCTAEKMERYSSTLNALDNLVMWTSCLKSRNRA